MHVVHTFRWNTCTHKTYRLKNFDRRQHVSGRDATNLCELKLFKGTIGHRVYTSQGRGEIKDARKTPLQTTEMERFEFLDMEREAPPK